MVSWDTRGDKDYGECSVVRCAGRLEAYLATGNCLYKIFIGITDEGPVQLQKKRTEHTTSILTGITNSI